MKKGLSPLQVLTGFTLIEILLTLGVMSVLSVFGIATYREYSQAKTVEAAAFEVQDTLTLARSRASTQVKPDVTACGNGRELYGYQVEICPGNCSGGQEYELSVVCGSTGQYVEKIGQTKTLPEGVSFADTQSRNILFHVLTDGVTGADTIEITGFGIGRGVSVSPSGVVGIGDVALITPTIPANTFYGVSGSLGQDVAEYNFGFSGSSGSYTVDMSTTSDMSWDVYISFGGGTQSPIEVGSPQQRWDKYVCGATLYWRVYNSTRTFSSPIQTGIVQC